MKNEPIGEYQAEDLRKVVERVLRDVGNPEPPLDLRLVREAQKLDLQYYSLNDPGLLQEVVHKVRVGATQLVARPAILFDVVRRASLSALWIPDGKRILIDKDEPEKRHRWMEAHEIGHSLTPWHARFLSVFGDDDETLHESSHDELEREANYVAAKLIFLGGRFRTQARDSTPSFELILFLHKEYGNSIPSTLRHFVEEAYADTPMVGLIKRKTPKSGKPDSYCIESLAFRQQFGILTEASLLAVTNKYRTRNRQNGGLGEGEVRLMDANGRMHVFQFESWGNKYYIHTLGFYIGPVEKSVRVPLSMTETND